MFVALLSDQKRGKSHLRGFSILLKIFFRVHELVAQAMRGECVRANGKAEVGSSVPPTTSHIPRVQTYHTKEPSRFVHALPARPHKRGWRARGSLCADESKDFRQPSPVGEGVSHRLTDEVSFKKRLKILCVYRAFGHSKAR